ncbi:unnamed protein product, partial [Closterium sp. NIES-53]
TPPRTSSLPTASPPTADQQAEYDRMFLVHDVTESRDAATCNALSDLLPPVEALHFSQCDSAKDLYDAICACYRTPSSASLGRLLMTFVFPDLGSFETVSDLVTHLHSLDTSFCATCAEKQLRLAPLRMWLTLHYFSRSPLLLPLLHCLVLRRLQPFLTLVGKHGKGGRRGGKGGGGVGGGGGGGGGSTGGPGGGGGGGGVGGAGGSGDASASSGGGTVGGTGLAGPTRGGVGLVTWYAAQQRQQS